MKSASCHYPSAQRFGYLLVSIPDSSPLQPAGNFTTPTFSFDPPPIVCQTQPAKRPGGDAHNLRIPFIEQRHFANNYHHFAQIATAVFLNCWPLHCQFNTNVVQALILGGAKAIVPE
jgi:hypothetical protein